jgi:hypothetical protein
LRRRHEKFLKLLLTVLERRGGDKKSPQLKTTMKRKLLTSMFIGSGVLLAIAAIAGPPVLPTLNPPAPSYYTCKATGSGALCRAQTVETLNQEPFGVVCGTAQNPVELLISGTDAFRLTRYYDTGGNLARRFRHEHFEGTLLNPVTGLTARLTAAANFTDTLAVPGNFDTVTTQLTGVITKIALPGSGVLLMDAGRIILDAQENVVKATGNLALEDYFSGNPEEAAKLCVALGSPGTP